MDQVVAPHISDLHMGHRLEAGVLNRKTGQRGHDPVLCRLLATRTRQVAAKHGVIPADLRWINSGDLTRTGDAAEFAVVRDFMETVPQRDRFGRPLRPTLGVPRSRYVEVPGNHDHWDGWDEESMLAQGLNNPPPAWNPNLFPNVFETTPWDNLVAPWVSSDGSFQVELFGVDSNSGLAGENANRRALGKISDAEFAGLEDSLQASNARADEDDVKRVRAIICHHAFTKNPQDGFLKARPLIQSHVDRLSELAATYRVAAILTGHTHLETFRPFTVSATPFGETQQRACSVCEIRCPTTLQGLANAAVHGFWVHHLFRATLESEVVWRPSLYKLAAGRLHPKTFPDLILP